MVSYIRRKHLLNRSKVEWTDYNCNHYVGCEHDCGYCYARLISRCKREEWRKVQVVENAMELAVKDILSVNKPGARIMVSSMSDPYQPIEDIERLTRSLIPILAGFHRTCVPPQVILSTKSTLVTRDFELIKQFKNISLYMTVTAPKDLPEFEPNAPGNVARMDALKEAHNDFGIHTIMGIEPWIPEVTKPLQIIKQVWPYVDEFIIGSWNHHYRAGSEAEKQAIRTYRAWLPEIVSFLRNHMKKFLVKTELAKHMAVTA